MIYFVYAPRFLFSFSWGHPPEDSACVYFTFYDEPSAYQNIPHLAGLVAQTLIPRCFCPIKPPPEDYEPYPNANPIEFEFQYTNWLIRTPVSPWGVPFSWQCTTPRFRFGNHGSFSVLVDFLNDGGKEIWRLSSGGKMWCGSYGTYPKSGEYSYQGERVITKLWELAKGLGAGTPGFPQLLWRKSVSSKHSPIVDLPSLTAFLPYKDDTQIYLFEYPNPKFSSDKLRELISIELVSFYEYDAYMPGYPQIERYFLGHNISETILLNLFYRAWDFFGPYAITIPRPEGMWIMTLSKSLKDKKRIERKTGTIEQWIYQVENYPIWEYKTRWFLANPLGIAFQKETMLPKASETSFIYYIYPLLSPTGEIGAYIYEIDYLARKWGDKCDLYAGIYLMSGRKLTYNPSDFQNVPDPNNLILFPKRDYPNYLFYENPWALTYYLVTHPKIKHRRFTQCYSAIPPYPSFPIGRPSPGQAYNWHTATGNFLLITWDERGWHSYDYLGTEISAGALDVSLPPSDILNQKLGEPLRDCAFLTFLQRGEMPETILFWFQPEDPNFYYIMENYLSHLVSVLYKYPDGASVNAHLPIEFCLNPQDPRPIVWGNLKMMVWRKGQGIIAEKDFGRYPIQYLFPAIENTSGAVYLPLLSDMQGDGSGIFQLFLFRRNDWSPDIYSL